MAILLALLRRDARCLARRPKDRLGLLLLPLLWLAAFRALAHLLLGGPKPGSVHPGEILALGLGIQALLSALAPLSLSLRDRENAVTLGMALSSMPRMLIPAARCLSAGLLGTAHTALFLLSLSLSGSVTLGVTGLGHLVLLSVAAGAITASVTALGLVALALMDADPASCSLVGALLVFGLAFSGLRLSSSAPGGWSSAVAWLNPLSYALDLPRGLLAGVPHRAPLAVDLLVLGGLTAASVGWVCRRLEAGDPRVLGS